jgi:hypothetical protein
MNPRQTGKLSFRPDTRLFYEIMAVTSGWIVLAVLLQKTRIILTSSTFAGCCFAGTVPLRQLGYILKVDIIPSFILLFTLIIFSVFREFPTTAGVLLLSAACAIILVNRLNMRRSSSEKLKEDQKQWTDFYQNM